jgi:hypothetical protein
VATVLTEIDTGSGMNPNIITTLIKEFNFETMPTLLLMMEIDRNRFGSIDLLNETTVDKEVVTLTTILEFPIIETEFERKLTLDLLSPTGFKNLETGFKSPVDKGIRTNRKVLIGDNGFDFVLLGLESTFFVNQMKRFTLGDGILELTTATKMVTTEANTFIEDHPTEEIPIEDNVNREISDRSDKD